MLKTYKKWDDHLISIFSPQLFIVESIYQKTKQIKTFSGLSKQIVSHNLYHYKPTNFHHIRTVKERNPIFQIFKNNTNNVKKHKKGFN